MRFQPVFSAVLGVLSIANALPTVTKTSTAKTAATSSKTLTGFFQQCTTLSEFDLLPRTAVKPTYDQLSRGAAKLAWALETLGVKKYGLIGGGATILWAHQAGLEPRLTDDVDLIVDMSDATSLDADVVSRGLLTNAKTKEFFVAKTECYVSIPHIKIDDVEIAVEIFDWQAWPQRKAYYDLSLTANSVSTIKIGTQAVSTLNLGWILRQKILAYYEREAKRTTDMADIVTLHKLMVAEKLTVTITDADEIAALKVVLAGTGAPTLKGTVKCASIPALA